jgi:excisionase family DNA binding protein
MSADDLGVHLTEHQGSVRLLDTFMVARRFGVTDQTIRNWVDKGKLRGFRTPTGRYKIFASEVDRVFSNSQNSQTVTVQVQHSTAS